MEKYESNVFGVFEPISLGITLQNLTALHKEASTEQRELLKKAKGEENLQESLFNHQKNFSFYYRGRTHEKAHWYTSISSSLLIAHLLSEGNTFDDLWSSIWDYAENTSLPIKVPLRNWVRIGECPSSIMRALDRYKIDRLIDLAVDGVLVAEHLADQDTHMLSDLVFTDLREQRRFWNTAIYKIGAKALIEGVGKAAEWIYFLKKDMSFEDEAWEDIKNSPQIYGIALDY